MINILEASSLAEAKKQELSGPFDLKLATSLPLKLPDGWRFPYDAYVETLRLRQTLLVLFVDNKGQVEEEWNDLKLAKEQFKEGLPQKPVLPSLNKALSTVQHNHPEAWVESVEAVLDISDESRMPFCWRIGIVEGINRYAVLIGSSPEGEPNYSKALPRSKGATEGWKLDRIKYRCRSDKLTVRLRGLSESQNYLRSQWTVWSCIAHVTEFVEKLGYGEIGSHNVRIEHITTTALTPGATFSQPKGIPTISFVRGGGWADDPTIVLHELGHALWYLLFTRPPRTVDTIKYSTELNGIEEGFADYFSAMLFAQNNKSVQIGGNLPKQVAALYRQLPRTINGQPVKIPPSADAANMTEKQFSYLIGQKWGNLLWDFRQRLKEDKAKADAAIVSAHVKPRTDNTTPANPLSAYFHSLVNTTAHLGIPFDDWGTLANDHQLTLE